MMLLKRYTIVNFIERVQLKLLLIFIFFIAPRSRLVFRQAMGQLNLLPFVGRETSTGKSAMMLRSWEIKTAWLIPLVDK